MTELLNKLSSYNLFNYLVPGTIFSVLSGNVTKYTFIQPDVVIGVFVYYFIGLVISRVGSLAVEPLLKWVSFVRLAKYEEFVSASEKDEKLEILSEANNTYRTFSSLFILILFLKVYEIVANIFPVIEQWSAMLATLILLAIFLLSYRKQTEYISRRVEINRKIDYDC